MLKCKDGCGRVYKGKDKKLAHWVCSNCVNDRVSKIEGTS